MTHHWTDEQLEFAAVQTPPQNTVIVIVIATFPMFFSVGRKCSFGLRGEIYSTQKVRERLHTLPSLPTIHVLYKFKY